MFKNVAKLARKIKTQGTKVLADWIYYLSKKSYVLNQLAWEVTQKCNLNCKHCYLGDKAVKELKTKDAVRWMDEFMKIEGYWLTYVLLTGGEPLLREDLPELVDQLKKRGIKRLGLMTNGTLIDEKKAGWIKEIGFEQIGISLDGLEAGHDNIRGKGEYKKTIRGLECLIKEGLGDRILIKTLIYPKNIDEISSLYKYLSEIGIKNWHWLTVISIGNARGNESLKVGGPLFESMIKKATKIKSEGIMNLNINENSDPQGQKGERKCTAGINSMTLLANGDIVPCINSYRKGSYVEGNITKDSIASIWKMGFRRNRSWGYHECGIHGR